MKHTGISYPTAKPHETVEQPQGELRLTGQRTEHRAAFNHSRHVVISLWTGGAWALTGYPIAWAYHRFGPGRTLTTTKYDYRRI